MLVIVLKTHTISEVAVMLSVSSESIRRYIKSNKLKASRVGRQWRISDEDLKEYFEKNSNENISK